MDGEYLCVTQDELARVVKDPVSALDWVWEVRDAEEGLDLSPVVARRLTTHKAWHAIEFLLARAGFPVDVVYGEEAVTGDADWGYGPPRYLRAERVRAAADA